MPASGVTKVSTGAAGCRRIVSVRKRRASGSNDAEDRQRDPADDDGGRGGAAGPLRRPRLPARSGDDAARADRGAGAAGAGAAGRRDRLAPHRGTGAARRPGAGRAHPPQRALRRRQRARGGQRRPGRLHAGLPLRGAAPDRGGDAAGSTSRCCRSRRRIATGSAGSGPRSPAPAPRPTTREP